MLHRFLVCAVLALTLSTMLGLPASADSLSVAQPAAFVRNLIDKPASEQDFAAAKLAVDSFADPAIDAEAACAEIDRMTATLKRMIATLPPEAAASSLERMKALRAFLYEPGWWNGNRPFQYDLADPYGQQIGAQLLPTYLSSRKGNCVSMPILFLVLAERIGLDATLATAPLHVFVKWTDGESRQTWNLEATSGAGFTRDEHYRKLLPMTGDAIENGVYMRALSRKEALALMSSLVLDDLLREGATRKRLKSPTC